MHIHYFQHDHFEDLGYIGNWADMNSISTSVTRFDINPILPSHDQYDWLIIMGGKMSVNDTEMYPWLIDEIKFIKQAIEIGKVVIGICLGSQLIARALGARVYRNSEPEMGFWPIQLLPSAINDPVFKYFPNELKVMHMHSDIFDLPENAELMAKSVVSPCQAFRYGKKVFALQFHFEISPQNAPIFIKEVSPELIESKYCQTLEQMTSQTGCCYDNNTIFSEILNKILSSTK